MQVSDRPLLFNQSHRLLGFHPLGDQDTRPHGWTAVPAMTAMGINNAPLIDHSQRCIHSLLENLDWDRK